MTGARPFLTVLIPAYNEEAGLARCVEAVLAELEALNVEAEILMVDDGSRDRTGEIAQTLAAQHARVRVVRHPVNRGLGAAFLTAVAQAQGDWLILIPADLAMDLAELPKYLEAAPRADIVVGVCAIHHDYSVFRRLVHWANIRLIQMLFGMKERQFQYISLYRLAALREMKLEYWRSAFFHAEILIKARALGRKLVEVEIHYVPRRVGHATGARWRLILRTVRDVFHFWLRWRRQGPVRAATPPELRRYETRK